MALFSEHLVSLFSAFFLLIVFFFFFMGSKANQMLLPILYELFFGWASEEMSGFRIQPPSKKHNKQKYDCTCWKCTSRSQVQVLISQTRADNNGPKFRNGGGISRKKKELLHRTRIPPSSLCDEPDSEKTSAVVYGLVEEMKRQRVSALQNWDAATFF